MRLHENWLALAFRQLYTPVLYSDHPQKMVCCDKKWSSAKLSFNMKCLPKQEAVGTRGLQSKFVKGDVCNPSLFSYTGWSKKGQSKAQWACSRCGRTWCALCGMVVSWIRGKTDHYTTCTGQQTFKLYESMMQLEAAYTSYSATDEATPEQGRKASAGRKAAKTIWANGTGFGGDAKYGSAKGGLADTQKEAKQKEQSTDEVVTRNLSYLTSVLREEMEGDDSSLFTSTCAILGMGNILNRLLRQLVANDSMLDISERRLVYTSMVELLKEFASLEHRDLDCILLGCDHSVDEACTLGKDLSVIKKMENIYKQAKVMVQRVTSVDGGAQVDDINLAKEFCACYESLEAKIIKESHGPTEAPAVKRMTRSKEAEKEADEERIKQRMEYKERLRTLQFKEVVMADENGQYKHYHNHLINGVKPQSGTIDKRGVHNQKRMLHMAKEISSLSTTLPLEWESSIHLYVDQNRLDVLRALIIGPSGTPYQNGIFQFDIFLPADYPQVPPNVHFLTTGSNRVRFNPNLYENGKICLSLLGTWSGPGWIPGRSTLLQVLVSIQSLIFVKEPYYNEPGFEQKVSPEAERESQRHRENTLSLAILAPLQKQDPFFSELISEHFRLKKEEVEQQCTEWLALATDSTMQQRMNQSVQSIKAQLATL
jgi:baculoviral IAP repeat-containing protein 6